MKEDGRSDEGRGAGGDKDTCAGKDEDEADAEENRVERGEDTEKDDEEKEADQEVEQAGRGRNGERGKKSVANDCKTI